MTNFKAGDKVKFIGLGCQTVLKRLIINHVYTVEYASQPKQRRNCSMDYCLSRYGIKISDQYQSIVLVEADKNQYGLDISWCGDQFVYASEKVPIDKRVVNHKKVTKPKIGKQTGLIVPKSKDYQKFIQR